MGKTLFDKIWEKHVVKTIDNGPEVLYIDRHMVHEVTSPQAFAGLDARGIKVRRPDKTYATPDHNVPTIDQHLPIQDALSRKQVDTLTKNAENHGVPIYGLGHPWAGIVHVVGPELGITLPGTTIVCGDSHTATHGAFGSIAFGIGTSEVEMVLSTQCMLQYKPKRMRINVEGELQAGVYSKDVILYIIAKLGTSGGTGYFVEYAGSAFEKMSMEARMTVCNMSIEMGARGGLIAPDQVTFDYLNGREFAPKGAQWDAAVAQWKELKTDADAEFDIEYTFQATDIEPMVTYGTNPGAGIGISGKIPALESFADDTDRNTFAKALKYMDLQPDTPMKGKEVKYVFIGSCTNSRIEDLRIVADIVKGKKAAANIYCYIVPGSKQVEQQAIKEGLKDIFEEAGLVFRQPGCSSCLAMNDDKVPPGEYCVATSNRNFEGRQGPQSRTFLVSPATAAATALVGTIADVRELA